MGCSRFPGIILLVAILIGQSLFSCFYPLPATAIDVESMIKEGIKNQLPRATQQSPIKVERKQSIEDLIPRQDIPYGFPPMIPLNGITIAGLGSKAIACLGENYFVVRSNTNCLRMCDLYRENRASSKANYVTMDCVAHPYLAFSNRIYAETIKRHLLPLTKTLLLAMLKVAVLDYKQTDDADVRTDIECNIAFLSLAAKLIDPAFVIPALGRVPQLVQADYDAVVFAKPGHSAIFDRNEDFSYYRPIGWYRSSPELITFHRVKTWMSRLNYPINDVTFEADGIRANNFRRSVLLYRSLDLARIDGKPAMDTWMKLVKGLFLLGAQVESWQEKNLYAHDYKSVFKTNSTDIKVTLQALAEPLYRTKLLLAVRKQKPLSLGSTSIFDLEEAESARQAVAAFRFVPSVGAPEDPWLKYAANIYPKPGMSTNIFPVALLDLNAWGAPQAANFLLDNSWAMDEGMPKTVSELKRWVLRRGVTGQVQPVDCRIWNLLSPSWRLLPDGIQIALRGQTWANRRLETVFSAWLDSRLTIASPHYGANTSSSPTPQTRPTENSSANAAADAPDDKIGEALANAVEAPTPRPNTTAAVAKPGTAGKPSNQANTSSLSKPATAQLRPAQTSVRSLQTIPSKQVGTPLSQTSAATGTVSPEKKVRPLIARRAARGHFLDPCPDFYNRLLLDCQRIDKELLALGFTLEPNLKRGLDDYGRLFQRFFKIAKDEVECKPLAVEDLNLLGNIDIILDKIDQPLPAVLTIEPQANFSANAPAPDPNQGYTMSLGRPGLLYMILMNKTTREWTLARGAVYTYYEHYGTTMNEETLLDKIDKGTLQPPFWTDHFDYVQAERN